jgi:anti-sigma factor ChrR (cupin superfamily)
MDCFSDEERMEQASLYALGALSLWEARAFEEHLSEGCAACAQELESFAETTVELAFSAAEAEAPPSVREKLRALVAEAEDGRPLKSAGLTPQSLITLRADEGEWQQVAKGITAKQLYVDQQAGTVTTLVRMQPQTRIPLHRHRGVEQCYVIEGDFHAAHQSLGPGDFHCAEAGSVHEPVYTVGGALVLIVASKGYEVLEQH